jgi:outer membrane biosynthesis protein TonB
MASESLTPPPASGGGYAKYLVVLLLVLGGGLGVFFATRKEPEPPKPAPPIKNAERPTALSQPTIEIPDEPEPEDAAIPTPEPEKKPVRTGGGDPWSCSGEIPAAELRRVVADNQSAIRSCYERQLRNDNQLQGEVKLQVRIGNDGRVTATRTGGNLRDNEVKNCIQNIAKNWTFPAPSQGSCAVFDAPFKFTPKQ